ncbi:MAG: TldD/PmbA family protein [Candidatus Bathyarchaeota archaeon]|nr:TldD/PmbA family protein [Candidatus Bathyarchaeota archaeon]MDH5787129.1 TldD/PmbA family protein [Candidatus Bathyarchaeota archaeon]
MLTELQKCVELGEKIGAEFVEARFEDLTLRTLSRVNDVWKDVILRSRAGIGIVCYYGGASGYSFTSSEEDKELERTVTRACKMAKASANAASLKLDFDRRTPLKSQKSDTFQVKTHPKTEDLGYKTDLVNRTVDKARECGKSISSIIGRYGELYGRKLFTNSEGSVIDWNFELADLQCRVTSKTTSGSLVNGGAQAGGTLGLEHFNTKGSTPEDIGEEAGTYAKEQIRAKACSAGKFRALIENRLAGVLAHESFGHLSEGDFIVVGESPLAGKIGAKLGTKNATIVDYGTPDISKFGGLWLPYDDQGMKASRTVILNEGVLEHYLHNRGTAKYLKQEPTANCRAVHFGFMPIPRMTNTYFTAGDLTKEEALESLDTGVYAIQTSGGQVGGDGSFLFKAERGYWVQNGEIKEPIREVSLSGNILNLLSNVEGGTKDLHLEAGYFGGCGKGGQFPLPCGLGGPELVIREVTFGGKAG